MSNKIDTTTLAILSTAIIDGNVVKLTCGQLERKQYLAVNAILDAIGGKWDRRAKGHHFDESPDDRLEALLLTGEYTKPKDYGYFPTPKDLVDRMVALAGLTSSMLVLEPSAGRGAIAEVAARGVGHSRVHCIELLPDNCEALVKQGFLNTRCRDFLSMSPKPLYDRVIMNPPFAKQQDIDHVTHALKCLKVGGGLVSIMASRVTFRLNRKTLDFMALDGHNEVIENPAGSFKLSGTLVNTVTVVIDKR